MGVRVGFPFTNDFERSISVISVQNRSAGASLSEDTWTSSRCFSLKGQKEEDVKMKQKDGYAYMGMRPSQPEPRELTKVQEKWKEDWLQEVEDGELDVYTCLGLSNMFSWTRDTRAIIMKAVGVAFLQMVVPFCLLVAELQKGVQYGPAEDSFSFRLVGFTLYGYAIYGMYNGADGHCRTALLNMMFQYRNIPVGNWLPLLIGEFSNVFTAFVLLVSLYSIFTTQVEPGDLIMNAVAVNFLCECDGSFVDREMRADAIASFDKLADELFTTHKARSEDPNDLTGLARLVRCALFIIAMTGVAGCSAFMLYPAHFDGERDTLPGFGRHIVKFADVNGTLTPVNH